MEAKKWRFWIDRGGTFTDVVALSPEQTLITHKLLSQDNFYYNSAIEGIRVVLGLKPTEALPTEAIAEVRMGTTLGTNALLEKTGSQVALVITAGLGDALRIGYQNRPDLFALAIHLPEMLYESVIEVEERYSANGEVLCPLDLTTVHKQLRQVYQRGIRSIAIVLMHGYRFPQHEQAIAEQARVMGFSQISVSHEVSPLPKLVSRGNTTVVDAYLTPVLRDYIDGIVRQLGDSRLFFMQSHGGLAHHAVFRGRDSILSGPAAGVVGSVQTAQLAGFHYLINFDMGGTSTDVSHWAGEYDRDFDTEVAGVRLQTPMMRIHTVAAGGGSICYFDGLRVRVGPHSAGANPGPAAYGKGGPLTVTDCNIMLGKLHSRFFPRVFGHSGQEPLDETVVHRQFTALASEINQTHSPLLTTTQIAEGFITIAVNHMATAIKKISVQRGYDVTQYTLCCFGGAGGQHACLVAEALDIKTIFIHPQAGVLSALGMGLAEVRSVHEQALTQPLTEGLMPEMAAIIEQLAQNGRNTLIEQAVAAATIQTHAQVHLRYAGTDTPILVDFSSYTALNTQFAQR
ncbi:MAG: hydantoinase/oxoprolinase family protein, partial [Pseudomonadota bacterium]|nr:hydantoinase/oxoprolinase family protein [Pseudomonadota bacterium]